MVGADVSESFTLGDAIEALRDRYGTPQRPPATDPFELILWENVAYLAPPARRRDAFLHLKRTIGTTPAAVLAADRASLEAVAARGILKRQFASKLQECAGIAIKEFAGDLNAVIRLPVAEAKRALRRFPGIGEPGAEKILLFTGKQPLLAPESNGLRVMARLGIIREETSYARTYAAARRAAQGLPAKASVLKEAHLLLQQHGQTLCTRNAPACSQCPLARRCAYAHTHRLRNGPASRAN